MSVHKAASPPLGGRLAFERAIRRSSLPAPARHVALTIATWADVASGVIPERFQPSLSMLAEATGMGVTTVKRHLGVLESEGWLLRDRPEIARARKEHARTKYALAVPVAAVEHGPERAMPRSGAGHGMGQSGPTHGPERAKAWSGAGHKSSCSTDEVPVSTTTSPAEPADDEPTVAPEVTDGGGGGADLRSLAAHITARLDYRGQTPDKKQLAMIEARLLAALTAGWSLEGLAVYLHLGDAPVRSAAAVYLYRLAPEQLPDPGPVGGPQAARGGVRGELPSAAEIEALTVDAVLFGEGADDPWGVAAARAGQRLGGGGGGFEPYRNPVDQDVYDAPFWPESTTDRRVAAHAALTATLRAQEAAADNPPTWCGAPDCDPVTRTRDGRDDNDLPFVYRCAACHPERAAA